MYYIHYNVEYFHVFVVKYRLISRQLVQTKFFLSAQFNLPATEIKSDVHLIFLLLSRAEKCLKSQKREKETGQTRTWTLAWTFGK